MNIGLVAIGGKQGTCVNCIVSNMRHIHTIMIW